MAQLTNSQLQNLNLPVMASDTLDPALAEAVDHHLAGCPICRQKDEERRRLLGHIADLQRRKPGCRQRHSDQR